MSVGRLVAASTSRFQLHRSGDHREILLHILSYKQAVGFMEDKPPGYCILRLDPVFIEQHSRSPLYITYKYNGLLLSQALRGPQINVKASKKKGVVICHTDKRHFSHILKMCDFLVRLRAFISEFVSNKNFVEKKIETDADLDKEILYRKFLIYPDSSTRLVVKKKKEDEVETAECGIVFENMSFFSKIGHDIKTIESFNDFLSAFLGVDSSSELECNQLPSQSPDSSLSLRRKSFAPITVNAKEKTRLIETLKGAISGVEEAQGDSLVKRTAAVQKVQDILKEIFESVKVVQLAEEKMDWINRGLLDTLILYREFLGFNDGNKSALALQDKRDVTIIKILKHLVSNNPEGSRALCISMFHEMEITQQEAIQVLEQQATAYGPSEPGNSSLDSLLSQLATLWEIFSSLIRDHDANPLPWIFVQELGVARLLDVYVQASMQAEKDLKAEEQRRRSLLKKTRQENMSVYRLELPSQTISKTATTQSSQSLSGEKSSHPVPLQQQLTNAQHSNSNIPSETVAFTPEMEQQLSEQRLSVRSAIISGNEQATEDEYLSEMPSTDTSYFSSDDSEDEDSSEESEETSDEDRSDDADDSSGTSSDSGDCTVQNNQSKGSPSRPMGQKTKKENPGLPADVPRLLLPTKLSNTPQLRDGPKEHTSSRWSRRIKKSGMLTPHTPVPPPGALTPTSLPPRSASASASFIGSMSGGRDAIVAAVNVTSSPASSSEHLRTRGHSFYLTARQELSNLATNLGATAVSSDLTALLPYKAGVEEQTTEQSVIARRKRQSQRLTMNLDSLKGGSSISVSRRSATNFQRYSTAFRIKRHAFNILACLASNPKLLYYIRNPANICFTELERMNRMDKLEQDLEFKQLIFSVLRPLAERVELVHRVEWQAVTESLPPERQLAFRRKLDRFLFRVHTALHAALSIHDHRKKVKEVENYLRILADYMEHCPTRVMSSQVLDVCMETVLHVKLMIFGKELTDSNGRFSMRHLRLINLLLRIFGAMACQNRHPPTMAFLLTLLVEPMDTISYVKDYAHLLLLNPKARLHIENSESKDALSQYCVTVLKYFNSLLQLLRRCLEDVTRMLEEENWAQQGKTDMHKAADFAFLKLRANHASAHSPRKRERIAPVEEVFMDGEEAALPYNGNDRTASRNLNSLLELRRQRDHSLSLLRRFEFLIRPETGFIAQFLNMIAGVHHNVHYEEEKEFLIFLRTALTIPGNPFVHQKHYIDTIISQHYLRFLKLYNGDGEDNKTLILCQLRLAVLLAFAESKNQKIVLKFFQLKTMDFLVRQVNLEYEIILKKAKYMEERVQNATTKPKGSTITSRPPPPAITEPLQKSPALHKSSTDLRGNSKSSKRKNPALRLSMPLSLSGLVSAVGGGGSSSSEASRPTSKLAISAAAARKRSNTALSSSSSSSSSATSSIQKATAELGNQRVHVDSEGSSDNSSDEDSSEVSIRTGSYDGHSSSDDDYDDEDSDIEDEKPGFSLGIPPLTLTAQVTKDGSSSLPNNNETPSIPTLSLGGVGGQSNANTVVDQGKDEGSESDDSTEASSEEGSDDDEESSEESEDDRPKPMIPTLLLTAEHTKDHSSPVSIAEAEATTARSEDNNNLNKTEGATSPHTPKQETAMTIPSLAIPSLSLDMSKLGGGSGIAPKTSTDDKELNSSRTSPQRVRFTDATGGETALVEGAQHVPKLKFTEEVLSLISDFKSKDVVEESLENKPEEPLQGLSAIEHRILRRDPSLQFLKKKNGQVLHMNRYKDEAEDYNALTPEDLIERNQLYLTERNDRKIYMSAELHTTCLQLIFSLMLTSIGTLESLYVDQYPLNSKKLNIPYLLHTHINHPANTHILPMLTERTLEMSRGTHQLLKLLSTRLLDTEPYKEMSRVAIGAYGTIYKCKLPQEKLDVAVKLMEVPKSIHDRCVLHDMFTEVLILNQFKYDKRVCQIYDYGVSEDYYWIMMKCYKCSLRQWRLRQTKPLSENIELYMNIFKKILDVMQVCASQSHFQVNHFDLKLDNILCASIDENTPDEEFWQQPTSIPNFDVCLADFGESTVYQNEEDAYTTRSRGTEFNKSPEMLTSAYTNKKTDNKNYDRRKKTGCGRESDVWALGCLFYELLTGEFLFQDSDWVRFFIRVTYEGQELFPPERRQKIDNNPILLTFFHWIFIRNPAYRPTLQDLVAKFAQILKETRSMAFPTIVNTGGMGDQGRRETASEDLVMILQGSANEGLYAKNSLSEAFMYSFAKNDLRSLLTSEPENDMDYFRNHASKITDFLYLGHGREEISVLKYQLDITHLLWCSEQEDEDYFNHFECLHVYFTEGTGDIVRGSRTARDVRMAHLLEDVIFFIEDAIRRNGKVLVLNDGRYPEHPVSIVLAYLMQVNACTYHEVLTFLKQRCYYVRGDYNLVMQMQLWYQQVLLRREAQQQLLQQHKARKKKMTLLGSPRGEKEKKRNKFKKIMKKGRPPFFSSKALSLG